MERPEGESLVDMVKKGTEGEVLDDTEKMGENVKAAVNIVE